MLTKILAVVLILGVIALIIILVVTSIITDSKKQSFKNSMINIANKISDECNANQMNEKEHISSYVFENGVVTPVIGVSGKLPDSGTINVTDKCEVYFEDVVSEGFSASKSETSEDVIVENVVVYVPKKI